MHESGIATKKVTDEVTKVASPMKFFKKAAITGAAGTESVVTAISTVMNSWAMKSGMTFNAPK